jgi:hypothetical protein
VSLQDEEIICRNVKLDGWKNIYFDLSVCLMAHCSCSAKPVASQLRRRFNVIACCRAHNAPEVERAELTVTSMLCCAATAMVSVSEFIEIGLGH